VQARIGIAGITSHTITSGFLALLPNLWAVDVVAQILVAGRVVEIPIQAGSAVFIRIKPGTADARAVTWVTGPV